MWMWFSLALLVLFVSGVILLYIKHKRAPEFRWKTFTLVWSFCCLCMYAILLEVQHATYYFLLPLALLGVFYSFYKWEKRRLINGLLFNVVLVIFAAYLSYVVLLTSNMILFGLAVATLFLLGFFFLFGLYGLLVFLYWNAIIVLKRERRSLANLLTLLLAVGLTVFLVASYYVGREIPEWGTILFSILPIFLVYVALCFYQFLTVSLLYQFNRPKLKQDYIVVLGAGLINGMEVSRLLGSRIDRAITFYRKQAAAGGKPPVILMSGGQGKDEFLSEAAAMKGYAVKQGIPETDILLEDKSATTYQNMLFSKRLIEERHPDRTCRVLFSTNNYHLFRAGLFAREAGLKADGIGAKTALYYLPNAFLREFLAILSKHKKRHLLVLASITLIMTLLALFQYFYLDRM